MGYIISNKTETTQVFGVTGGRVITLRGKGFRGNTDFVNNEEFEHPNIQILIANDVLKVVSDEEAKNINEEAKKKEPKVEELEFTKENVVYKDVPTEEEKKEKEKKEVEKEEEEKEEEVKEYQCVGHTAGGKRCKRKVKMTEKEYKECGEKPLCKTHAKK